MDSNSCAYFYPVAPKRRVLFAPATLLIFVETQLHAWNQRTTLPPSPGKRRPRVTLYNSSTLSHYRKRRAERAIGADSLSRETEASLSAILPANSLFARDSAAIISTRAREETHPTCPRQPPLRVANVSGNYSRIWLSNAPTFPLARRSLDTMNREKEKGRNGDHFLPQIAKRNNEHTTYLTERTPSTLRACASR